MMTFIEEQRQRLLAKREAYMRMAMSLPSGEINMHAHGKLTTSMRFIERALARIEEGTYGTCVDCGEQIPPARLRTVPGAIRCTGCQQEREATHGDTG
ncbi:MAG TPA: TraR/DksA family transcriptional regulator [Candidatus Methylomirabilis sp.]|nr:TraR/DksA family transcriptional regulator [Candidatus Methylomirabilis sp.]